MKTINGQHQLNPEAGHQMADHYRSFFNALSDAAVICQLIRNDSGGAISFSYLEVNDAFRKLELTVSGFYAASAPWWARVYQKMADTNMPAHQEFLLADCWFEVNAFPFTDDVFGVVFRDITAQKQHEQSRQSFLELSANLQKTEEKYRQELARNAEAKTAALKAKDLLQATLNSSLEMIQVFKAVRNPDGRITDFIWILNNNTSAQIYGDVIGKSLLQNNPGVVKEGIFQKFVEVTESGIPQQYERHYVHEQFDGWFYQSVVKLDDGVATSTVDITERKTAGLKLEKQRKEYYSLVENTPDVITRWDKSLKLVFANSAFVHKTGLQLHKMIGKTYLQMGQPAQIAQPYMNSLNKVFITGEAVEHYNSFPSPTGETFYYSRIVPERNTSGEVETVLGIARDITAIRLAEQRINNMEAEKQKEIFKATLAIQEEERRRISESLHNGLGQLLYGIKISLSHLTQEQALARPEVYQVNVRYTDELLTKAIRESRRISHELMPAMLEDFGLQAAVEDICKQFSESIRFSCFFKGFSSRLDKYLELAIYRTIQELMTNVIKHAQATAAVTEVIREKDMIVVRVKDNGIGINTSEKAKPGIGLTSIRSKIKLLNGEVKIENRAGGGTVVQVHIPVSEEASSKE